MHVRPSNRRPSRRNRIALSRQAEGLTRSLPCQHFYAKTVAVISQARGAEAPAGPTPSTPPIAAAPDDTGRRRTVSGATKTKRSNKWVRRRIYHL